VKNCVLATRRTLHFLRSPRKATPPDRQEQRKDHSRTGEGIQAKKTLISSGCGRPGHACEIEEPEA
jgi:hypothetical protein